MSNAPKTGRDPRDLSQYVILKHWQFWLYATMIWISGALMGATLMLVPVAHADPAADDRFLAMLENAGLQGGDRAVIINNGHIVCKNLWSGTETFDDQVSAIRAVETALTEADARTFVAIAITAYCPDISARRKVQ